MKITDKLKQPGTSEEYRDRIIYRGHEMAVKKVLEIKLDPTRAGHIPENTMTLFAAANGQYYLRTVRGFRSDRTMVNDAMTRWRKLPETKRTMSAREFRQSYTRNTAIALFSFTRMSPRWALQWSIAHVFNHNPTREFLQDLIGSAFEDEPNRGW